MNNRISPILAARFLAAVHKWREEQDNPRPDSETAKKPQEATIRAGAGSSRNESRRKRIG
jgi:hypothetical protein